MLSVYSLNLQSYTYTYFYTFSRIKSQTITNSIHLLSAGGEVFLRETEAFLLRTTKNVTAITFI